MPQITQRERAAILSSLAAGVAPSIGLAHIQVGRKAEVAALIEDLKRVEDGAASVRIVVGQYGAGKTFFLNLVRAVALERRLVVVQADITTERRLQGTQGYARALYAELMKNLATRSRPEGGGLANLVERWIGDLAFEVTSAGGTDEDVAREVHARLSPLQDLVAGYDFAHVLAQYYRGHAAHDQALCESAIRWLRGEFATRTEAREALGVRTIIDDASMYDYLKLLAGFTRIAGQKGLLVLIDELAVLSHRLNNKIARDRNYEAILRIVNDCLQGSVQGLGFVMAATDDCLTDPRRGLYSYPALAQRLQRNRFATGDVVDMGGPVITLKTLTAEEAVVMLRNIRRVHAAGAAGTGPESDAGPPAAGADSGGGLPAATGPTEDARTPPAPADDRVLPDEGLLAYLEDCHRRMGAASFQTPRETARDFVGLLSVLEQNPGLDWRSLLARFTPTPPLPDPAAAGLAVNDEPPAASSAQPETSAIPSRVEVTGPATGSTPRTRTTPPGSGANAPATHGVDDDLASFTM